MSWSNNLLYDIELKETKRREPSTDQSENLRWHTYWPGLTILLLRTAYKIYKSTKRSKVGSKFYNLLFYLYGILSVFKVKMRSSKYTCIMYTICIHYNLLSWPIFGGKFKSSKFNLDKIQEPDIVMTTCTEITTLSKLRWMKCFQLIT